MNRGVRISLLVLLTVAAVPAAIPVGSSQYGTAQAAPCELRSNHHPHRENIRDRVAKIDPVRRGTTRHAMFVGTRRSQIPVTHRIAGSNGAEHFGAALFAAPEFDFSAPIAESLSSLGGGQPSSHLIFGPISRSPPL